MTPALPGVSNGVAPVVTGTGRSLAGGAVTRSGLISQMSRWFESSSRYMDDHYDARKELNNPTARKLMRQFLNHDGPKGNKPEYDRGYEYTFRFSQAERDIVNALMNEGMSFAEAFDGYKASLETGNETRPFDSYKTDEETK